jgi:hypothetical protein
MPSVTTPTCAFASIVQPLTGSHGMISSIESQRNKHNAITQQASSTQGWVTRREEPLSGLLRGSYRIIEPGVTVEHAGNEPHNRRLKIMWCACFVMHFCVGRFTQVRDLQLGGMQTGGTHADHVGLAQQHTHTTTVQVRGCADANRTARTGRARGISGWLAQLDNVRASIPTEHARS